MKKLFCTFLVLAIALSFAACGKDNGKDGEVTIYIPDTVVVYMGDGTVYASITYVFEEGWQDKDSFTVTMTGDTDKLGGSGATVYTDKKTVMDVGNGATMEIYYNDKGQHIKTVNLYADGGHREVTYTYDQKGKLVAEEMKRYETADSEAVTTTYNYTYTDTETGYTLTQEVNGYTVVITYDKNGLQISQVVSCNGEEESRTETTYDAVGNMLSNIAYYKGEKQREMHYTWKAVEVSSKTAAWMTYFNQG